MSDWKFHNPLTPHIGRTRQINETFAGYLAGLKHAAVGSIRQVVVYQPNLTSSQGTTVLRRDGSLSEGIQKALEVPQALKLRWRWARTRPSQCQSRKPW